MAGDPKPLKPPTTVNETASKAETVIGDAVKAATVATEIAAEAALHTYLPFTNLPVIRQVSDEVIKLVVEEIGKRVSVSLQLVGAFIVIDTQVSHEKSGISHALQDLLLAEKSGDPNAIQAAIQAYANAQSALVRDDGSARPH